MKIARPSAVLCPLPAVPKIRKCPPITGALAWVGVTLLGVAAVCCGEVRSQEAIQFSRNVAPILLQHCSSCHNAKKAEGNYRVDTFAELVKPGDSGLVPVAVEGEQDSELLRRLITTDVGERMPEGSEPLSTDEIEQVRRWLAAGALFDGADPQLELTFVVPAPRHPQPPDTYPLAIPVNAVAFSPAGDQVIVGGYHELTVWDAATGKLVRRIDNIGQRTYAIRSGPAGDSIAVACGQPGRSGEVRLLDWPSGQVTAVVARSADVALDVAFRPDGTQLAVAGADSLIQIVDLETMHVVSTLAGHADWVTAIGWSRDGGRLVSASRDKTAKVFEAGTGELLTTYAGHAAAVRGVMLSADATHVFSAGADNQLHRWETIGGKRVAAVGLRGTGFHLSGDEANLLVPSSDGRLLQIDLTKNAIATAFVGLSDWATAAAWHPPTGRVVAGSFIGEVAVWGLNDSKPTHRWVAKP